jgi:hypothetical protein
MDLDPKVVQDITALHEHGVDPGSCLRVALILVDRCASVARLMKWFAQVEGLGAYAPQILAERIVARKERLKKPAEIVLRETVELARRGIGNEGKSPYAEAEAFWREKAQQAGFHPRG